RTSRPSNIAKPCPPMSAIVAARAVNVSRRELTAPHGTWDGAGGPPKAGGGAAPECMASAAATHSGVDGRSFGPSVPSRVTGRNTYTGTINKLRDIPFTAYRLSLTTVGPKSPALGL